MQHQWKDAYPGITGQLIYSLTTMAGRSVEQGSYSALWALTDPSIEKKDDTGNDLNGYYFSDPDTPGKETSQASDPALGKALWELSERLVREKVGKDGLEDWNKTA